jgi:RNA recognition motif-containing protein
MQTKVFVSNLVWGTTSAGLEELFAKYGSVVSVQMSRDESRIQGAGFAFVEMENQVAAEAAIRHLNMYEMNGRSMHVRLADPSGGKRSASKKHRRR